MTRVRRSSDSVRLLICVENQIKEICKKYLQLRKADVMNSPFHGLPPSIMNIELTNPQEGEIRLDFLEHVFNQLYITQLSYVKIRHFKNCIGQFMTERIHIKIQNYA